MSKVLAFARLDATRYRKFRRTVATAALIVGGFGLTLAAASPVFADGNGAAVIPIPVPPGVTSNLCNGDAVSYTGTSQLVYKTTVNNNTAHLVSHFTLHINGTSTDGTVYVGNGGDIENINMAAGSTTSFSQRFSLISQGSDPNYAATGHYHLTVDANGTVTATFDRLDLDCTP
jgi:hypothetical protein